MKKTKAKRIVHCLWALWMLCVGGGPVFAQQPAQRTITGKISNRSSGEPIIGASITVRGTSNSTATDETGNFSIQAGSGDVLVVTTIGFASREIRVGTGNVVDVRLEEDYSNLEDVVIVGYGTMKKTDLTSAQVTVTNEEIKRTVNTTLEQALQGRAANVYVSGSSGQPGAPPVVIVRGISSLSNNVQPLYVIDGVQINLSRERSEVFTPSANILSSINPDDIETINVLQGPSATAIFGAAGANGVVMITTKRGKAGETKISFNSLWTLQDKPEYVPVMNLPEYAAYRNEFAAAGGAAYEPLFADPSVLGEGTNWQDALMRRSMLKKNSLSLSGGSATTNFYFSGEAFDQEGVLQGSGFRRYALRFNLDNQTRKWLKLGTNMNVSQVKEIVDVSNADLLNIAIGQNPGVPVKNPDGSWGGPATTQFQYTNPVALAVINDDRNKINSVIGGVYMTITPINGLVIHNEANASYSYRNEYRFHPSYQFGGYENLTTTSTRTAANNYWWGLQTRIQYSKQIGNHNFTIMAGHESQEWGSESVTGERQTFPSNNIQELPGGDAGSSTNNSSKSSGAQESYFSRINYIFKDRYIVQGTIRRDGSSNFGEENRWGNFPSVSAAWRISEEAFMQPVDVISDLKLRVEYGLSGNSVASGYWAQLQSVPTGFGTGFLPANFSNPFLKWEVTKTFDIGFDLHMFQNRLEIIADVYFKKVEDLLTTNAYPFFSGGDIDYSAGYISFPTSNVGEMQNHGFGITINTVNIERPFTWRTGLNFSIDRNEVSLLHNKTPINRDIQNAVVGSRSSVGNPVGLFYGYIADGIFQSIEEIEAHAIQTSNGVKTIHPISGTWVGDIKFRDLNKDGIIDQNDRTLIGNPWPKFSFGFNNFFSFKNFDLNLFFVGVYGNDVFNVTRYRNESTAGTAVFSNYFKAVANFARPSNRDANTMDAVLTNPGYQIARIAPGDPNLNNRVGNWYIEDGSYLRLKNVQVSYNFPTRMIRPLALKGLRVSVNVQNVFTITKYKGYDPEVGFATTSPNKNVFFPGVDDGRYPSVRMYSFNLLADF